MTPADEVKRLTVLKHNIEEEIDGQRGILEAENSTMNSPLLTEDGFPRGDIDVFAVRHARTRLIELRNDHKDIMSQIEAALHQALARPTSWTAESTSMEVDAPTTFALVKSVDERGPAGAAGLKSDDQVITFGAVNYSNNDDLKAVAALVGKNENIAIPISVLRGTRTVNLSITPRSGWGGRGLLGLHIVPMK